MTSLSQRIAALERHWAYEAAVDVAGKNGNKDQLGTAASLRAILKTQRDTLQFYTAYDRQETDGLKSADQFKAGVDYQNNFRGRTSWYVRDEGGFDRIKDIELYNVAAVGFGYDVIKEPKHVLTTRAGLSYRYEGYKNPTTTDVKSAGLDFGLAHELTFGNSKLVNRLSSAARCPPCLQPRIVEAPLRFGRRILHEDRLLHLAQHRMIAQAFQHHFREPDASAHQQQTG